MYVLDIMSWNLTTRDRGIMLSHAIEESSNGGICQMKSDHQFGKCIPSPKPDTCQAMSSKCTSLHTLPE